MFVAYPVCQEFAETQLPLDILMAVLFLAAFLILHRHSEHRVIGVALGIVALIGQWTNYALPGLPSLPLLIVFHLAGALFLALTIASMLRHLFNEPLVTANSIYAALCAYLLIGLTFAHLYSLLDVLIPRSFRLLEEADPHAHFQFAYFSFCTLTTLGYGDITPVRPTARGLAIVEAVIGQFFLAVLIAELVGKRAAQTPNGPPPPQGE
jgi:hypothetical protein